MRLLLVLLVPLRALLTIGRMDGWKMSSGGMVPTSTQEPPPYFDIQSIGNTIFVDGIIITSRVKDPYCCFKEERLG